MEKIEQKIDAAGWSLPPCIAPAYAYQSVAVHGEIAYVSGHVPKTESGDLHPGKVGRDITLDQARAAAELATLNALSSLGNALGGLDRVERVVKLVVFVASGEGFNEQPKVAEAASALLNVAFGVNPGHARSAVGVAELPRNSSVEVELVAVVKT
jgi:enamine deaminase RidA (YjgF/YER057c/UK114 family)